SDNCSESIVSFARERVGWIRLNPQFLARWRVKANPPYKAWCSKNAALCQISVYMCPEMISAGPKARFARLLWLLRRVGEQCKRIAPHIALTRCPARISAWILSQPPAADIAPGDRRSGYDDMSRETKAMQDDDTANPGMLAVLDGEALWNRKVGAANRSCADCHGDATQ